MARLTDADLERIARDMAARMVRPDVPWAYADQLRPEIVHAMAEELLASRRRGIDPPRNHPTGDR